MLSALFPALAQRDIRIYLSGQALSVIGLWTQTITLNLIVYELTKSAVLLGATNFLLHGPMLFVAPMAGKHIGPHNARHVASLVMLAAAASATVVGILTVTGNVNSAVLLSFATSCGILSAIEMPARQVLLTSCVKDGSSLANAVAMNTLCFNLGRTIGPAIAAFLFLHTEPGVGFFVYTASLLVMTRCIAMIDSAADAPASGAKASFRDALRHVFSNSFTALFLVVIALLGVFASSYQTLIPVLADKVFGDTATVTGMLFTFAGTGSLTAAIALSSKYSRNVTAALLALSPWLSVISLGTLSLTSSIALAAGALYTLGFTLTLVSATTNSTMQRTSPPHLRGAIAGLYGMAFLGTLPIGHLLMGGLASQFSVRAAFFTSALVLTASLAILYLRKWNADRTIARLAL
ncbi:MAG: MFS transporter [Noviherbaspirillum sp.]